MRLFKKNKIIEKPQELKDTIFSKYNFVLNKEFNFYYISDEVKEILFAETSSLNSVIKQAGKIIGKDTHLISIENIECNNLINSDYTNLTRLYSQSITKSGKSPKYCVKVYFNASKSKNFKYNTEIFGYLYYLSSGKLGKAEITTWINSKCYILNILLKKEKLTLTRIYTINEVTTKKEIIYSI